MKLMSLIDSLSHIQKFKHNMKMDHAHSLSSSFLSAHNKRYTKRMLVESGNALKVLYTSDIQWIEASGNYIKIYVDNKSYLQRGTLSGFLKELDPEEFQRIHRSYVVNLNYIDRFEELAYGDYEVVLKNGKKLKMTRSHNQIFDLI